MADHPSWGNGSPKLTPGMVVAFLVMLALAGILNSCTGPTYDGKDESGDPLPQEVAP